jgi:restriction endonuclease Mrr
MGGPVVALGAAVGAKLVGRIGSEALDLARKVQAPAATRTAADRYDAALAEYERWSRDQQRLAQAATAEKERLREEAAAAAVLQKEAFWRSLSGTLFELTVAELLRLLGHEVERVGGKGDRGVDLIIDHVIPVQCKAHKGRPLGPRVVREFLGAMAARQARVGYLVTLDGCTPDAARFAAEHGIEVWDVRRLIQAAAAFPTFGQGTS